MHVAYGIPEHVYRSTHRLTLLSDNPARCKTTSLQKYRLHGIPSVCWWRMHVRQRVFRACILVSTRADQLSQLCAPKMTHDAHRCRFKRNIRIICSIRLLGEYICFTIRDVQMMLLENLVFYMYREMCPSLRHLQVWDSRLFTWCNKRFVDFFGCFVFIWSNILASNSTYCICDLHTSFVESPEIWCCYSDE